MNSKNLNLAWAPVAGLWAFLWAAYIDIAQSTSSNTPHPATIVTFMAASTYLTFRFTTSLNGNKDSISKISSSYSLLWALAIATIIALVASLSGQVDNPWLTAAILGCVVVDITTGGLINLSDEQLTDRSANRSMERTNSLRLKEEYLQVLEDLESEFPNSHLLNSEISRIKEILPYTSFTRNPYAPQILAELKAISSERELLSLFRKIR